MLTTAETNIRMGTAYFADLVKQFGGVHLALASYNAGESRVARWMAERPGVERDEFIDDIPFPETQNYVKKILGTAEDYRRLYGGGDGLGDGDADAMRRPWPPTLAPPGRGRAPAARSKSRRRDEEGRQPGDEERPHARTRRPARRRLLAAPATTKPGATASRKSRKIARSCPSSPGRRRPRSSPSRSSAR